jgi:L-alanine-DL-glutamate epimerase-like enolase superfamily enzyme
MLDSVWAYDYEDAVRVGRAIEDLDFLWYEDPLAEDDIYNYVKLRQKLDIPILATEYAPGGIYGLAQWVLQGATDILRGDVTVKAGITSLVKIAHMAEAFRMKCEIHHGGNSMMNVANLHVAMAINNCDYFEVLLPHVAQKYGLVHDIEVDKQGFVHAPDKPGLGYEIDWDLVKRNTTQVLK